nr:unnamed protein product [Digitaria exilis]
MVRFTKVEEEALQKLTSLQELLGPKDCLPRSLTELSIIGCPAIRSLPKGILPSSLQTLDVRYCCEELRRQCSKLRGKIPIIKT